MEDLDDLVEKIHLSQTELEQNLQNHLVRISRLERTEKARRQILFPRGFEQVIADHLLKKFRRECWLLKETPEGEMEIEIDLEYASILHYFNGYEDAFKNALRTRRESITLDHVPKADDLDFTMSGDTAGGPPQLARLADGVESMQVEVHFDNPQQMLGWGKFIGDYKLKEGEHYELVDRTREFKVFKVYLQQVEHCENAEDNIAKIKKFFDGDYLIKEIDRGGMGAILKLTAKHDPTFLSLRTENLWARQKFSKYLTIIKDDHGNEKNVYAEIPQDTRFVVKVAFEGCEEDLIQEAALLTSLAEDPEICQTIIGAVQHGRVLSVDDGDDQQRLGYYLILEFAPEGNTEQLYQKFPNGCLTDTVAFSVMYGMVITLQKLKRLGIIHRDIKPLNLLLGDKGVPKLSDFGLSITTNQITGELTEARRRLLRIVDEGFLKVSREREQAQNQLTKFKKKAKEGKVDEKMRRQIKQIEIRIPTLISQEESRAEALKERYRPISAEENAARNKFEGSIYYCSPEQLDTTKVLTPKCDVYQLGAVMFTMLTGYRPVFGNSLQEIVQQILKPDKPAVSDFIQGNPVVDAMSDLIKEMLINDPEQRIDIDTARERMDQILFTHALQLKKMPVYDQPPFDDPEREREWKEKVEYATKLHSTCMETLFSSMLHN